MKWFLSPLLTFRIQPGFFCSQVLYPDTRVNKGEIAQLCQRWGGGGSRGGSAGGCLQRFVACVSDQSYQERHGAVRSMRRCSPDAPPAWSSSCRWRRGMRQTPGAGRASQLIPRQAIGGESTSVRGKQSTICSGLVVMRTKAGEGGGAPGEGRLFGWGQGGGSYMALLLENHPLAL